MRKLWCHIFWQIIKQRSCQRGGMLEVLSGEGGGMANTVPGTRWEQPGMSRRAMAGVMIAF